MTKSMRRRGEGRARASEHALLRRTRAGAALLGAWWLLLAVAVVGVAVLAPLVARGWHAAGAAVNNRELIGALALGGVLLALCIWIVGMRAAVGIAGLVAGIGLVLFVAKPAIAAGAEPAVAAWTVALLMTFVTLGLTYGGRAVAVGGTVGMAVIFGAMTGLAAVVFPIVAPGKPLLVAIAVLAGFGGLCDVAITQVSTVIVASRRVGHAVPVPTRLREIRDDSLRVGGDHLVSMVHTLGFATLGAALVAGETRIGPQLIVALIASIGMALATGFVTYLASWAIGRLSADAVAGLQADDHH